MNPVAGPDGDGRRRSPAPPLALLFLALATVFLFGGGRSYLESSHVLITQNHMTVAMNLSPEHGFLGFYRLTLDGDGNRTYEPYNRFPVLGHVLIKLATLPFPDDLSARLSAARMLMLAFFAAAATTAWLALCRLVRNRWAALAATLLSFSSYYALYYNDMVATEGVVDLFGVMLVFHGMAVYATEGRFGQLPGKTCVALLLGWHVYALLLPYVVLGLAVALRRRDGGGGGGDSGGIWCWGWWPWCSARWCWRRTSRGSTWRWAARWRWRSCRPCGRCCIVPVSRSIPGAGAGSSWSGRPWPHGS